MKTGISKAQIESLFDADWLRSFPISEWDFSALLELSPKERKQAHRLLVHARHTTVISAGAVFFPPLREEATAKLPSSVQERLEILAEISSQFCTEAFLLRVPLRFANREEYLRALRATLSRDLELWLDPGKKAYELDLPQTQWVADPMWHPRAYYRGKQIMKTHGWHEARWVRYYGPERLKELKGICQREKSSVLLFGHSKREEEAHSFALDSGASRN